MIALYILLWWLCGVVPILLLSEQDWRDITPSDLLIASALGLLGPCLGLIVLGAVVSEMNFWHEPIFGRRKKDDN